MSNLKTYILGLLTRATVALQPSVTAITDRAAAQLDILAQRERKRAELASRAATRLLMAAEDSEVEADRAEDAAAFLREA